MYNPFSMERKVLYFEKPGRLNTDQCIAVAMEAASRDGYVPHPDHRRVASKLGGMVEDVLVFDFDGPS